MIDPFHSGKSWETPELTNKNRLPMRSPLFPFPTRAAALADAAAGPRGRAENKGGLPPGTPWALSLDGSWRFVLERSPEAVPAKWADPSFDDGAWGTVSVPGSWSLQGYDKPHYTNVVMPFGNVPPSAPRSNPTGLHRRRFVLPKGWEGRRVVLHVGSAESFLSVFANGTEIGFSKDARLPAEFDLTPYVRAGENLLALMVIRYSDSSYVEDQDQWWLGGLHRSVYLYSTESAYIADVDARPILAADLSSGSVDLAVRLGFTADPARNAPVEGAAPADYDVVDRASEGQGAVASPADAVGGDGRSYSVRCAIFDPGGTELAAAETEIGANYRLGRWEARTTMPVAAPAAWSAETPALYALSVTLFDPEGREIESAACRIGFRSVLVRDRKLLINGKRVIIKGANRHEHDERTGKTLSLESMIRDIELLKRHNFNAVRTSHYPNDERWYELCDEYGLYLVDEANIESHAYYDHLCRDPRWLAAFADRVSRMAIRDKNHASVIMWSLGNESGYGPNHDAAAGWLRSYDPNRPLHYEGACRPDWGQGPHPLDTAGRGRMATDIVSTMYPTVAFLEEWDRSTEDDRPFIMCEFSHAMGNSNGSLSDYWALIESGRGLQGGFIWEWMDHGLLVGNGGANTPASLRDPGPNAADPEAPRAAGGSGKAWRYGGDFGDAPADLDFIADGLVFPDRTLKPAMAECAFLFRPIRVYAGLPAENFVRTARHGGSPSADDAPAWGSVFVENRFDFIDLGGIELTWAVVSGDPSRTERDGVVARGAATLPAIPSGAAERVSLGIPASGPIRENIERALADGECVLHAAFSLSAATPWAPAGHVIAREQLPLSPAPSRIEFPTGSADGTERGGAIRRLAPRFGADGFLDSLKTASGTELLASSLVPCLFRAPTQNDGLKNFMSYRGKSDFAFYYTNKAMYGWLDSGLDDLRFDVESMSGSAGGAAFAAAHRVTTGKGIPVGRFLQRWAFRDDGPVADFDFELDGGLPELPRVGLVCSLSPTFAAARWFGLGPHEAYSDRKAGARLGVWEADLAGLSVPYIVPQDNGNRHAVRWAEFGAGRGSAVPAFRVSGNPPFDFSLSPYADRELWEATHWDLLPSFAEASKRGCVLHLDAAQRGVGTATCGPDTLERYRLRGRSYRLSLSFASI